MVILNIAEKPSVAKSISRILSTTCSSSRGMNKYCPNIYFEAEFNGRTSKMVFTSVLGHLFKLEFEEQGKWNETNPRDLLDARIQKTINTEHKTIASNLKKLCTTASLVVIWTDCDREGENIAVQIQKVIESQRKIEIRRARFSAISRNEIINALETLQDINYKESNAVDARMELDLRIGSAFTRIQTITHNKGNVLSFGPCQIPTLNFIVQRFLKIQEFFPEKFFSLKNEISSLKNKEIKSEFKWNRGNIFDKNCVIHFYNSLYNGKATIISKKTSPKDKYRPLPLRTVEFQKICSSFYKIDSHRLMDIAEKLYNNGYISYPRTETDSFPKNFGFSSIINKIKGDIKFGEYASNFEFKYPRNGSNNDQAHSPIYPLKDGSDLQGDERKIFEFIARRFLGCVSDNAKGLETEYIMKIASNRVGYSEEFTCKGLQILERNYLNVYIYDKWESSTIGEFQENEVVENNLEMTEGATTKPELLTESELITLMDKNGIGTDATIHEHIHKVQIRGYAKKEKFKFLPLKLGINLIKAYNIMNLPISEPILRKNLEINLKKISTGEKDKIVIVREEIEEYKRIYDMLFSKLNVFKDIMDDGDNNDGNFKLIKKSKASKEERYDEDSANQSAFSKRNKREAKKQSNNVVLNSNSRMKSINQQHLDEENIINTRQVTNHSKANLNLKKEQVNQELNEIKNQKNNSKCQWNPKCECGENAKLLETRSGENTGRKFFTCHFYPKKCAFFSWQDTEVAPIEQIVNCTCGFEAQKKIANTESNRGREFYCCKKSFKKCKFFKWVDEVN